jgi:glutathione S-transferase
MTDASLLMLGAPGSPYSRKLRAVLRFRRIPYRWVNQGSPETRELPRPKVPLLPTVFLPDADGALAARTDTSPLIRDFESRYPGRSVIPTDPALAFLDALLEDFGDEWLTKCMFHYRWYYEADVAKAAAILPRWSLPNQPEEMARAFGKQVAERQIERLWVVGSNDTTAPVIEASYRRILSLLDARLTESRFLLGGRPGTADFAIFGQLTQLVGFDPTPAAIALETAPRVVAWVDLVEELSGIEPAEDDWIPRDAVPASVVALLGELGRVYVPFLLANAAALESGAERVECSIDGLPWEQRPFPYQGKCLRWLREGYAALATGDRAAVDGVLAGTGCEALFA